MDAFFSQHGGAGNERDVLIGASDSESEDGDGVCEEALLEAFAG
jgi:hypothetical protein